MQALPWRQRQKEKGGKNEEEEKKEGRRSAVSRESEKQNKEMVCVADTPYFWC